MEIIGVSVPKEDYEVEICVICATEKELSECDVITREQATERDIPLFCHRCGKSLHEMQDATAKAKAEILLSSEKAKRGGFKGPKGSA